jgi:hypothetical protein
MTRNPHEGLNEARELERIRLNQLMSEGAVGRETEIRALQAKSATRGGSGFMIGVAKIIFDRVAVYVDKFGRIASRIRNDRSSPHAIAQFRGLGTSIFSIVKYGPGTLSGTESVIF